jgi:DNA-binding MarR family transcriptional regulator
MATDSVDRIIEKWAETDPGVDASPLAVVGRILLCADYLRHAFVAALEPLGLSFADFDVINTIRRRGEEQGTKPGDLAQSSLITSGAMTTRLDRLERAGLITRSPDPADGRGSRVRLTRRGESLAEHALLAVIAADRAFLEPLTSRQRDQVAAGLKALLLAAERDSLW